MSEQQPEQTSGETGSLSAAPAISPSSDASNQPAAVSQQEAAPASTSAESPTPAPTQVQPAEMLEADAPKADSAAAQAPDADAIEPDAPHTPGQVIIMSSGDRAWANSGSASEPEAGGSQGIFGKHRIAALAAVVALAVVAGAVGGALATAALTHVAGDDTTTGNHHVLEASVARTSADLLALKAGLDHTSKLGMGQFNKTSERLDKLEKAQAEPAAKLARLSEAVDKLRATPAAAAAVAVAAAPVPATPAPAVAKEVTGSVSPEGTAANAPKVEVARLPTLEGWVLRDVARGGALIDGRRGIYEVYAGDFIPGLGRVDAIRRQDGRWVVVTTKGLIVAR